MKMDGEPGERWTKILRRVKRKKYQEEGHHAIFVTSEIHDTCGMSS